MKILVTGATGFLGSWVLSRLVTQYGKENVVGTGRNVTKSVKMEEEGFVIVRGDLTDPSFVKNYLQGFTHVVHCAAKSSLWGSYDSFYRSNVVATQNLLNEIHGIERFIYISTPSIYFMFSDRFQVREDSALPSRFVNHYTATKYLAEKEVLACPAGNMIRVILRPRALVGAGDTVIVPRVIRAFKAGKLRIIGDGKNICDFTSVKNISHAVALAISSGREINGKIFNITDGQPIQIWRLMEDTLMKMGYEPHLRKINYRLVFAVATISELMHRLLNLGEPVLTRYGVGLLRYSQTLDISAARQWLGYEPIVTTEESLAEFIESYRDE
ncbi:MAG: NAD-dependent epimerase/dehydratase family protein [Bacteroidales bacterium]|nr:NAD-dependent epimerase/dehydratase family protein [Bacteroidales bacterium]